MAFTVFCERSRVENGTLSYSSAISLAATAAEATMGESPTLELEAIACGRIEWVFKLLLPDYLNASLCSHEKRSDTRVWCQVKKNRTKLHERRRMREGGG